MSGAHWGGSPLPAVMVQPAPRAGAPSFLSAAEGQRQRERRESPRPGGHSPGPLPPPGNTQRRPHPQLTTAPPPRPLAPPPDAMVSVFLFVPNLIGYTRIILALLAFYLMPSSPLLASSCYLLSSFLDCLDGYTARLLNQCSKFGMMLDMLTDRCATMCLLVNLSLLYPRYIFLFQLSMILDICSHWLHLHSSTVQGSSSHKKIELSGNPILHLYYTNKNVLFLMCAGNEIFYAMLYLLNFMEGPMVHLDVGLFRLLLWISFPICVIKTAISLVHLVTASQNMAARDQAEREQACKAH